MISPTHKQELLAQHLVDAMMYQQDVEEWLYHDADALKRFILNIIMQEEQ